ncbi:MAG: hypothetical protein IPK19_26630 [Chloroflexi bacterium]|nr:hypothetical protein [Chloroflexota bacterium]
MRLVESGDAKYDTGGAVDGRETQPGCRGRRAAIATAILQADALLSQFGGKLPYNVPPASPQGQQMLSFAGLFDIFNNGQLTQLPAHSRNAHPDIDGHPDPDLHAGTIPHAYGHLDPRTFADPERHTERFARDDHH